MTPSSHLSRFAATLFFALLLSSRVSAATPPAAALTLPPLAVQARDLIYSGDPAAAIPLARSIEQSQPALPLGFLLEGEAEWWQRYCAATEIKYGMVEAWSHSKVPGDEAYLALADHAISLAQAQLAKSDTAEMHVYAGFGFALKTRVYGLRGENHNAARAGVAARAEMLRALQLDPQNPDALAGLGIYNYYVETLSPVVKFLRIFMGIPGGNKELGVEQMQQGMARGSLLDVDVRFILARALRQYDQEYEQALAIALPLVSRYPRNPEFLLLAGNLNAELGRDPQARQYFRSVLALPPSCSSCSASTSCLAHSRDLAHSFLALLH